MSFESLRTLADLAAAQQEVAASRPQLDPDSAAGRIVTLAAMGNPVSPEVRSLLDERHTVTPEERFGTSPPGEVLLEGYNGDNGTEIIQWQ